MPGTNIASQSSLPLSSLSGASLVLGQQVSFFRQNLTFKVVPKVNGKNEEGQELSLVALLNFIK